MKSNKYIIMALTLLPIITACDRTNKIDSQQNTSQKIRSGNDVSTPKSSKEESQMKKRQHALGAMSSQEALEYMKRTDHLVIIDVAATRWYEENHFKGAIHIPIEELSSEQEDALYMKIPKNRPVLMHCRRGMIVPSAYERVLQLRPDIPEISYIDGTPLFDAYNQWLK